MTYEDQWRVIAAAGKSIERQGRPNESLTAGERAVLFVWQWTRACDGRGEFAAVPSLMMGAIEGLIRESREAWSVTGSVH